MYQLLLPPLSVMEVEGIPRYEMMADKGWVMVIPLRIKVSLKVRASLPSLDLDAQSILQTVSGGTTTTTLSWVRVLRFVPQSCTSSGEGGVYPAIRRRGRA